MRTPHILFDLDGTLLDTLPGLCLATQKMLAELGRPVLPAERIANFVGKGMEILIKRALNNTLEIHDIPSDLLQAAISAFDHYYRQLELQHSRLYPHVRETLDRMQQAGWVMALVTNKPACFTHPLLEHFHLAPYFAVQAFGDTYAHKKPHPEPLEQVCQRLHIQPSEAVFVGDSANDVQAAQACHMPVLVVPYGYREGLSVQALQSSAIMRDFAQVWDWCQAHFAKSA